MQVVLYSRTRFKGKKKKLSNYLGPFEPRYETTYTYRIQEGAFLDPFLTSLKCACVGVCIFFF